MTPTPEDHGIRTEHETVQDHDADRGAYDHPEPVTVRPVPRVGYVVASRTVEGAWWLVEVGTRSMTCSCPRGRQLIEEHSGRSCFHMRAATSWQLAQDRKHARPSAPPNVSALVD